MEAVTEYANSRTELEERIQGLEAERSSLVNDIATLKERLAVLELERNATSLSTEVEALRTEKAVLEEKISTYAESSTQGYQV